MKFSPIGIGNLIIGGWFNTKSNKLKFNEYFSSSETTRNY